MKKIDRMSSIRSIKSEKYYDVALERLDELFDSPADNSGQVAESLAIINNEYEAAHYEISAPDPKDR